VYQRRLPDARRFDAADSNEYFFREYHSAGSFTAKDIAAGSHCMTPKFLKNQLGRSLKNLGVECVDVYYLHNPETQLSEVRRKSFSTESARRLRFRIGGGSRRDSILRDGHMEWFPARRPRT